MKPLKQTRGITGFLHSTLLTLCIFIQIDIIEKAQPTYKVQLLQPKFDLLQTETKQQVSGDIMPVK